MGKKIIVAGAGHGGLIAAAHLAQKGYDVTVYERNKRKELGYDWLDAIDPKVFDEVGLPHIKEGSFERNGDMMFYNPALSAPILVPEEGEGSAKIERKYIYDKMIRFAKESGVKIVYHTTVLSPIMDGTRVAGINTTEGKIYADLIIDSCGIDSPLRSNLPHACDIIRDYEYGDCFYGWRAYFNRIEDAPPPACDYEVFLVHMGKKGISWNVFEHDKVDVLIGRMYPFTVEERNEVLEEMRRHNPQLGTEIVRGGGEICKIPIANPLPVMVCDGYACIGDAAYMTHPMNGSGIVASMKAGKLLAEVVAKDTKEEYTAKTLWEYNYRYIHHFGAAFASVGILKNVMLSLPTDGLDFLFDKQIITKGDIGGYGNAGGSLSDLIGKATRGITKLPVLLRTAGGLSKGSSTKEIYREIPKEYNAKAVRRWQDAVRAAHIPMSR